ncbi:unnamed protein product [Thelazia callipaeda]|uniref:Uncharacterized protein n=1 Tax=Thelazia callipaeda TaxID=103827 RepID=A0A0N5CR04_THECL|nr:unnamed protein product [Thelazia callipaeda]
MGGLHTSGEECDRAKHDGENHGCENHDGENHDGGNHDGENHDGENDGCENHDGENHDGENHDGGNHDGENYDGRNHDGENHDSENHNAENHDSENYNGEKHDGGKHGEEHDGEKRKIPHQPQVVIETKTKTVRSAIRNSLEVREDNDQNNDKKVVESVRALADSFAMSEGNEEVPESSGQFATCGSTIGPYSDTLLLDSTVSLPAISEAIPDTRPPKKASSLDGNVMDQEFKKQFASL